MSAMNTRLEKRLTEAAVVQDASDCVLSNLRVTGEMARQFGRASALNGVEDIAAHPALLIRSLHHSHVRISQVTRAGTETTFR